MCWLLKLNTQLTLLLVHPVANTTSRLVRGDCHARIQLAFSAAVSLYVLQYGLSQELPLLVDEVLEVRSVPGKRRGMAVPVGIMPSCQISDADGTPPAGRAWA